jgi:hypothetical protein
LTPSKLKDKRRTQEWAEHRGFRTLFIVQRGVWVLRAFTPVRVQFRESRSHILTFEGDGKGVLCVPDWGEIERIIRVTETEPCLACEGLG